MHGLVCRSFESFLRHTYGGGLWAELMFGLDAGIESFEPMFHYDDALFVRVVATAADRLDKPRDVLLEDWGTFLVAAPASERVRRLLRFGGSNYEDFLLSLAELPGRARLAVPDLELPRLDLRELGDGEYSLDCHACHHGAGRVFLGLLRALADDYGALVLIDHEDRDDGIDRLSIRLLEARFAEGRGFQLAEKKAG